MSVFEKAHEAIKSKNPQMFSDLLHDDFEFVRHQTGTSMNKSDMDAMIPEMIIRPRPDCHSFFMSPAFFVIKM